MCLFAVLGRKNCKFARENRPCPFRHPELAEDKVTADEFTAARERALQNAAVNHANSGRSSRNGSRNVGGPSGPRVSGGGGGGNVYESSSYYGERRNATLALSKNAHASATASARAPAPRRSGYYAALETD